MLKLLKKRFRNIKKLPNFLFIIPVYTIRFAKLLMRTEVSDPHKCVDPEKFPFITVTWHNRLLFFPAMFEKPVREKTVAMVSSSRDGQYVTDICRLFGIQSVRGSSSKKGFIAFNDALKYLKDKCNISITPDGPRGPRYHMSKGPVALASRTGYPVLPVSINYSSYWELRSWDRFQIPKPWAKVRLVLGKPIQIPENLSDEDIEKWRETVEDALNSISAIRD
jgi:lysophospholipid acyltransferase (LPLAT)-like uncharacterized protein